MTVIALLEKPDDWGGGGLLGWIDCFDGSIACNSAPKYFGLFLLSAFFAIMFPIRAYDIFGHPENAPLVALFVFVLFGGFALHFLYLSAKALLVRRSLVTVRDLCEPKNAKFAANPALKRDAAKARRPLTLR